MRPQLDEHILHDVLGGAPLPENVQCRAVDRRTEPVEGVCQSIVIARSQAQAGKQRWFGWPTS